MHVYEMVTCFSIGSEAGIHDVGQQPELPPPRNGQWGSLDTTSAEKMDHIVYICQTVAKTRSDAGSQDTVAS